MIQAEAASLASLRHWLTFLRSFYPSDTNSNFKINSRFLQQVNSPLPSAVVRVYPQAWSRSHRAVSIATEPSRDLHLHRVNSCRYYQSHGEGYVASAPQSEHTQHLLNRAMQESTLSYTSQTIPNQDRSPQTVLYREWLLQ